MQPANIKTVGIIGAGHIGQTMAKIARRAGRQVVISNREGPRSLASLVQELDFNPSDLNGHTSSEVVAGLVAPARVVKAGNTLGAPVLASDPQQAGGERVIFLSGDDADAKSEVGGLFEDAGFFVIDLGGLREGGQMQQFGAPLAGHNLIRLA